MLKPQYAILCCAGNSQQYLSLLLSFSELIMSYVILFEVSSCFFLNHKSAIKHANCRPLVNKAPPMKFVVYKTQSMGMGWTNYQTKKATTKNFDPRDKAMEFCNIKGTMNHGPMEYLNFQE